MKRIALIGIATVLACGCSPKAQDVAPETTTKKEPSSLKTMVDGATGAQAVRSGTKASNQIRALSATHESDLNEIMDTNQ